MPSKQIVDAPHCEHCGQEVGLRVGNEFTLRIADWHRAEGVFTDVPSKKFATINPDDEPAGLQAIGLYVCSVDHGKQVARPGQFIITIDEGDLVNPIAARDHRGYVQAKFWVT